MKTLAYKVLLKKYLLVDLGVLILLITLPLFSNPDGISSIIQRSFFYSGFITPMISYFEIKKNQQLLFFDNLNISIFSVYTVLFLLKVISSLIIALYV